MTATTVTPGLDSILATVDELAPLIRQHADEAEQDHRLAPAVVDAMREAGLYGLARPKVAGGFELDPASAFRVTESIARHDSAVSWNVGVSVATEQFLAWLPDEGVDEILGTPGLSISGGFTPSGTTMAVDGGYRVTGQWSFVSGCQQAKWLMAISLLMDDDGGADCQGGPRPIFLWIPADQMKIVDNWNTLGMRGTGSHDVMLDDLFVPAHRAALMTPLVTPSTAYCSPIYRLGIWPQIASLAPPALGTARAAIDDFVELASRKTPSYARSTLRNREAAQYSVAEAEAHYGAGSAYFFQTFEECYASAAAGNPVDLSQKLRLQLAISHAVACAATAVDLLCKTAGTSAIRNEARFQRYFRDVHTNQQHAFASAQRYQSVGALMLGSESDWNFFAF